MAVLTLQQAEDIIQKFVSASARFRIVQQIGSISSQKIESLFILDSSYNPPSLAHASLAITALRQANLSQPHRLLLLFSTSNADKSSSPAAFQQRLVMMSLFGDYLHRQLGGSSEKNASASPTPVDIGLTTEPYYTDKSMAITESDLYGDSPKHVHLMGYDTLVRFLAPKYYNSFNPPLSALSPYFDNGHSVGVLLRPSDGEGASITDQRAYIRDLRDGSLTNEGFKEQWVDQILVMENDDAAGISSTDARNAASRKDWDTLGKMVPSTVAQLIEKNELYHKAS